MDDFQGLADKTIWTTGLALGFQGLIVVGFVSQLVPLLLTRGVEQGEALAIMTVANLGGAVGSYVWGFLDQKFGIKPAAIALSAWMMIGCLLYFVPGVVPQYLMLFILGSSLGGPNNYAPSMTTEIYGRGRLCHRVPSDLCHYRRLPCPALCHSCTVSHNVPKLCDQLWVSLLHAR